MASLLKRLAPLVLLFATACGASTPTASESPYVPAPEPSETAARTATLTPAPTPTITLTPTPGHASIWIQPVLPETLREAVDLPTGAEQTGIASEADLRLEVSEIRPVSRWIYALVAPFPEIMDGVSFEDILKTWQGVEDGALGESSIYVDQATFDMLSAAWGEASEKSVVRVEGEKLVDTAWADRPSYAIVPFEQIGPRWKVLEVDGQSPLRKEFDASLYPLAVSISIDGSPGLEGFVDALVQSIPESNRDPDKLTTVVMTGVTALVRGTSNTMYSHGNRYPAEEILPWLQDADILHISNEVPFAEDCPVYNAAQSELKFCTNASYIELLEYIGADVIELTGDHFADWGSNAMMYTLNMYKNRGWPYYGGGATLEEGLQPITMEHNGNQIAFIGCNAKGGGYATADEDTPGAAECDFEYMTAEIERLTADGYLVIATMQHQEYYTYKVRQPYDEDFELLASAGAVIVNGSQAHLPQAMTFEGDSFIHFGLGNLFFDQYNIYEQTNDAFIDRHVFYDGRYLGVELLTIRFVDYARSRPMTVEERAALLEIIFKASGW